VLAMACPSCGAPVPLSLADPDRYTCRACDSSGALPPEVLTRLEEARTVLHSHSESERQLGRAVRTAVTRGGRLEFVQLVLLGLLLAPVLLVLLSMAVNLIGAQGAQAASLLGSVVGIAAMAVLVAVAGALSLGVLRWTRNRVSTAAAAVPPAHPGESVRCHVCGGPLVTGVNSVARCSYCSADNVVDAAIIQRASASRLTVLDDYAGEVATQSTSVSRAFGCGTFLLLSVVSISPFVCVVPLWLFIFSSWAVAMVFWILSMSSGAPTPGNRYGLVESGGRQCIAWYNPYTKRWERDRPSLEAQVQVYEPAQVTETSLDELVGRDLIRTADRGNGVGQTGVASRPHWGWYIRRDGRTVDGPDVVDLGPRVKGKLRQTLPLWQGCIHDSP